MAATIVNTRANLPVSIKVSQLKHFEKRGVKKEFLVNLLVNEKNEFGVIRDTYFMVATGKTLRTQKDSQSLRVFATIMERLYLKGFDYVMINF